MESNLGSSTDPSTGEGETDRRLSGPEDQSATAHVLTATEGTAVQGAASGGPVAGGEIGRGFERQAEENAALANLSRVKTASTDMGEVYEMMVAQVQFLVPFDRLVVSIIDAAGGSVHDSYVSGLPVKDNGRPKDRTAVETRTVGVTDRMYGSIIDIDDERHARREFPHLVPHAQAGLHSFLAVPLVAKGQMVGTLHLQSKKSGVYGDSHLLLAERVAAQIAGFIQINDLLRRLRSSQERYRDLFDNAPVGYVELDVRGYITDVNRTQLDMFDYKESEMVGRLLWSFFADPVADSESTLAIIAENGWGGEGFEVVAVKKSGRTFFARFSGLVLRGEDGEAVGMRIAVRDVTRIKQLEGQLARSQRMDALGKFAGGIAHDFSNMLTSMVLHIDRALATASTDVASTKSSLRQIQWAADRASDLTRKLLAFSRRQPTLPIVADINRLLADMNDLLKTLAGDQIILNMKLAAHSPMVRLDVSGMEQAIINLVVNARDAMPRGGSLFIATAGDVVEGEDGWVRISVGDTGTGMDEKTKGRIFEPFFTTKEPGRGTGLGLSTSYGMITQFGGTIEVDSAPGMGSVFSIRLPRADAPATVSEREDDRGEIPTGKATILLVEDDPVLREMIGRTLGDLGYTVLQAADGMQALAMLNGEGAPEPDLVMTDVFMPVMGGEELAQRMREVAPHVAVLFTSGYSPGDVGDGWPSDMGRNFLQKPFSHERLAFKVANTLEAAAQRKAD